MSRDEDAAPAGISLAEFHLGKLAFAGVLRARYEPVAGNPEGRPEPEGV